LDSRRWSEILLRTGFSSCDARDAVNRRLLLMGDGLLSFNLFSVQFSATSIDKPDFKVAFGLARLLARYCVLEEEPTAAGGR
jgi:hypothetical protein